MIIILVVGASLRPFPLVVLTTNLLPNHRVGHIEKPEEQAAQMGKVSNSSSGPLHGSKEFNEAIDDHQIFGRDREEEINVDEPIGKEPTVSKKNSVDRSRGSNNRNKLVGNEEHCTNARPDSTKEKISQELPRPPIVL